MKGFNIVEEGHFVNLYTPIDIDTLAAAESPVICLMENWSHATIIVSFGVPKAAGVITVHACDDIVPTTHAAIAFRYYRFETSLIIADGDVHGALTWATTAGITPVATTTPAAYIIELDAEELPQGYVGFRLAIADPGAASVGYAIAILSGARYADANVTAQAVV